MLNPTMLNLDFWNCFVCEGRELWDRTLEATEFCKQSIMGHCGISLEDQNTKKNRGRGGPTHEFPKGVKTMLFWQKPSYILPWPESLHETLNSIVVAFLFGG